MFTRVTCSAIAFSQSMGPKEMYVAGAGASVGKIAPSMKDAKLMVGTA